VAFDSSRGQDRAWDPNVRLWSLHPGLLDAAGLVALWREGLLARAVLLGRTRGYRHHPQLERFREARDPVSRLDCYLSRVLEEAEARGYAFDASKIVRRRCRAGHASVSRGQLAFEWDHLLRKLATRNPERFRQQRGTAPRPHPCFQVVPGGVATWEKAGGPGSIRRARPDRHPRR
jgi:hypothetical protein